MAIYKSFCSRVKDKKLPCLAKKINHWLAVSNIMVNRIPKSSFKPVAIKDFNAFISHVNSVTRASRDAKKDHELVHLSDDSSSATKVQSTSTETGSTSIQLNFENQFSSIEQDKGNIKDLVKVTRDRIKKFKAMAINLPPSSPNFLLFIESAQIHNNLLEIVDHVGRSTSVSKQETFSETSATCDIHIINEEDKTKELGNIMLIEGLLPVRSSKYKKAMASLPSSYQDREPSQVIATLAKMCFPDHWITGVTLKGSGGRKSLLELWNHDDPLKCPVSGEVDKRRGSDRYQALIDHTMRKCGKKSYDSGTEKHLGTVLSKAIHYKRTKILTAKGWDDMDETSSDDLGERIESDREENEDDDEDEVIPPPKNRRLQTQSSQKQLAKNTRKSGIIMPEVSMVVGSPVQIHNQDDAQEAEEDITETDEGLNHDIIEMKNQDTENIQDNESKKNESANIEKPESQDEETQDAKETELEMQSNNDNLMSEKPGTSGIQNEAKDKEKSKILDLNLRMIGTNVDQKSNLKGEQVTQSQSSDDFEFDDDDEVLNTIVFEDEEENNSPNFLAVSPPNPIFSPKAQNVPLIHNKNEETTSEAPIRSSTPLGKLHIHENLMIFD